VPRRIADSVRAAVMIDEAVVKAFQAFEQPQSWNHNQDGDDGHYRRAESESGEG
jgi:hypothetical protein